MTKLAPSTRPKRWAVVVPTCRLEQYEAFVQAWAPLFLKHDVEVFTVFDIDGYRDPDMPEFIPTGTDMIRSWGIYKAWKSGAEFTLSLDDDVRPPDVFDPFVEYERTFKDGAVFSPYLSVGQFTESDSEMRGFPYGDRPRISPAIQYGGWHGVLDYDAATQLTTNPEWECFSPQVVTVPQGARVTTCIMNAAWRTKYAPIMWQLPLLEGKYNRFGDIWSGLFQKRVLDIIGFPMVINGRASIIHQRASNVLKNLEREFPGIAINEIIGGVVFDDNMPIPSVENGLARVGDSRMLTAYEAVTDWTCCIFPGEYRAEFLWARDEWLRLFA